MGIVAPVCRAVGIPRSTFYNWYNTDETFREHVDEINEEQIDMVESKLLENIQANDQRAIQFYLQTKAKGRGYTVRDNAPATTVPPPADKEKEKEIEKEFDEKVGKPVDYIKRIEYKKNYLVRLLKKEGRYSAELSIQAKLTADVLVRLDVVKDKLFSPEHRMVMVETSREGNERKSVDPLELLYMRLLERAQLSLRALGMNADSKPRKDTADDGFGAFMDAFKDNDQ